ncbi:MAG: LytTR family DNA-binding domain-containing protein [Fibromonadaceae bacterium]|jgi:DNA-binding LytR/AlgR family response regulator|nr:LytTR family DNA-binding domain-containing protein [Fibromonadaceae bacterium]
MNILICDDMEEDANRLATLIAESGFDVQTMVFTCPFASLDYFRSGGGIDACFLDIIMPKMNGIKLAEKLRENNFANDIVFLTTSNDFASQSYQVQAFDYLLKPLTCEKVNNVIDKLKKSRENADKAGLSVTTTQGVAMFIHFRDISHAEVIKHNVYIKLLDKSIIKIYTSFSKITEQLLLDSRFAKCHCSYIVNLGEIKAMAYNEIIMKNGSKIPISKGYWQIKDKILKWMMLK